MEGIRKTVTMSGDSFTAWFQVDETYDIASNSSVLSITEMKLKTSDWYGITMILDGEILINGHSVVKMSEFQGTHSVHISAKNEYVPVTGNPAPPWRSLDIPHNSDGSASTSVTVRLSGRSSGGGVRFRINGTEQMPLTTIPRVSEPSLSAEEARMGESITVFTNRKSRSFTHSIHFSFGPYETTVNNIGDSYTWHIPLLAEYIPDALSGKCNVMVTTYAGNTKLGERSLSLTLIVPQTDATKPVIEQVTLAPDGRLPQGFEGLFIRYKTGVAVTIQARGQYSSIKSCNVTVEGKTYNASRGSAKTDILSTAGETTVTVTVVDKRGFETTEKRMIPVLSYENPAVVPYEGNNQIVAVRATVDGTPSPSGENLLVQAGRKYAKVISGGVQKNFCALRYRIQAAGGAFSSWKELVGKDAAEDSISIIIPDAVSSTVSSYDVELQVVDAFGGSNPIALHIPTDKVSFHIREGGKGAAFGKYAEQDGVLESAWDMDMLGNRVTGLPTPERQEDAVPKSYVDPALRDYIVAEGVSGNWFYRKWDSGFAECWQMLDFTFNNYLDKSGQFFRYPLELTYPFPFIQKQWSRPNFNATIDSVHGLVTQRWTPERFKKFSGYVNTFIQYGTNNATGVNIYVSGYWK